MIEWPNTQAQEPKSYVCAFCGRTAGSSQGFYSNAPTGHHIYICTYCGAPTYFDRRKEQYPGVPYGAVVRHLPDALRPLYNEARAAFSVGAFTAAVLTCRKLLMNVAVQEGAEEGKKFIEYVEFLADEGYVPPHGKGWVDHIRKRGNEANHEIVLMESSDAEELISFVEMLLKFIYEFPGRLPGARPGTN